LPSYVGCTRYLHVRTCFISQNCSNYTTSGYVGWHDLIRDRSLYKRCYMTKGEDRVCFWTYGQQTDLTGAAQFCLKLNMTLPIITEDTDVRYGHRSLFYRYLRSSPAVVRNSRLWLGLHKNRWTAEWNWLNRTDEQLTLSPANITGSLSVCLSFFFSVFVCCVLHLQAIDEFKYAK